MKSVALIVWIFINLVCFGMCGYFYLIWSQYWMNLERHRLFSKIVEKPERNKPPEIYYYGANGGAGSNNIFKLLNEPIKLNVTATDPSPNNIKIKSRRDVEAVNQGSLVVHSNRSKKQINVIKRNGARPRFASVARSFVELDSKRYQCEVDKPEQCAEKVEQYKTLIMKEFKRLLMEEGKSLRSGSSSYNPYKVDYDPKKFGAYREKNTKDLMCELTSKNVRTITGLDAPFAALGFGKRIPKIPLLKNNFYNSCAIVASSGSLLGSNLGDFIDSHDLVLRFNHAPTRNFSQDVGSKTTIRVVNSQVVTKKRFRFLTSHLYRDISLLAWDPGDYSSTLAQWYKRPDFDLFPAYRRFMRRSPDADFHLLHPGSIWQLWDFIQSNSPYPVRKNPPSSGFIGLAALLPRCSFVDVFEYLPSARLSSRCHYYHSNFDPSCTFGAWHPLAAEKALAYRLNGATDFTVFQAGYIRLQGFQHLVC